MKKGLEMKNTYCYQVRAQCPVNPMDTDLYDFLIESDELIKVEEIVRFFEQHAGKNKVYQESLTHLAAVTIGAKVTSVGIHSGVTVKCVCP
jgi:hypothetical protein